MSLLNSPSAVPNVLTIHSVLIPVTIAAIRQETPSIKGFELDLLEQEFEFLPGQWIDCYAETMGLMEVAGYSITSSPLSTDRIEIAVKLEGENPVTHLLHKRAEIGTSSTWSAARGSSTTSGKKATQSC